MSSIKQSSKTYVIGHRNPDTDSIASAMGYAWLLRDKEGEDIQSARAGHLNPQTVWTLDLLGLEPPVLLPDASPRFETIARRFNTASPESTVQDVWAVANKTGGVVPIVNPDGTPYGLVTVLSLFEFMSRSIGTTTRKQETPISEIFDRSCQEACDTQVPRFQAGSRIRDAVYKILHEERSEFLVVNEKGLYVGICRQRDALNPPRLRLILVDHNEAGQALGALDEADLIEVLDHHRLSNPTTRTPIRFTIDVVGSTSTLVSERIDEAGLSAPPALAGLLLAGVVSDTLILNSPTTTDRDRLASERLARWAFVGGSPIADETVQSYGEKLLHAGSGLASREPVEIVSTDFKQFEDSGKKFGISQVEVTNKSQIKNLDALKEELIKLRDLRGLDFAVLMITDVVRRDSYLLITDELTNLDGLPFPRRTDGIFTANGVVSRKMQLLPAVLGMLKG